MKELFLSRDSLANRISYYHLMLFLLSLPFDQFYSHLVLISFSIHTLLHFYRFSVKPIVTWRTLVLQSVFFVTVISTIYTPNKPSAFREWGLDISIFLIPLLFCINPIDLKRYGPNLLKVFSLGCAATILCLYFNAINTLKFYRLPLSQIFSPAFTNHNFSQPIGMHATFFSLQIGVALIFMLSLLIKEGKNSSRIFNGFVCLLLLAGIIQLSSKSVFIALFLIINIAFPVFLLKGIARKRFIMISGLLTATIVAIIFSWGTFRERYLDELRLDFAPTNIGLNVEPRLMRWDAARELVGESPVIGHGAGTEIPLLKEKYYEQKYYTSYLHGLNAHNEYLSFLIKSGIWGLLAYVATLFYGFRIAIRKKDVVFFGLMMLIAVVSLSENILDVDKGVMFYSFFLPFFVFISEQKSRPPIPAKKYKNLRKVATKRMAIPSSL